MMGQVAHVIFSTMKVWEALLLSSSDVLHEYGAYNTKLKQMKTNVTEKKFRTIISIFS